MRRTPQFNLVWGSLLLGLGAIATVYSYFHPVHGGYFTIWWGAMALGLVRIIVSLVQYNNSSVGGSKLSKSKNADRLASGNPYAAAIQRDPALAKYAQANNIQTGPVPYPTASGANAKKQKTSTPWLIPVLAVLGVLYWGGAIVFIIFVALASLYRKSHLCNQHPVAYSRFIYCKSNRKHARHSLLRRLHEPGQWSSN